jgi:ankyrin repeat protein
MTLLLVHDADPNARSGARGEEGLAALHVAAKKGNVAGVRILLGHGADSALKDEAGRTPLELTRNKQVAKLLETAT